MALKQKRLPDRCVQTAFIQNYNGYADSNAGSAPHSENLISRDLKDSVAVSIKLYRIIY